MAASMAASMAMRKWKSSVILNALSRSKVTIPERFKRVKEGRIGKAGEYIANILSDYKGATVDIFTDAKDRPVKAALYVTALCCTAITAWNNPDAKSFERSVQDAANDLLLLSDAVRNPVPDRHLQGLLLLQNQGRIRRLNLVVCSVVWVDNYSKSLALYDAQCEYLQPGWRDFNKRILDVGFMNKWYYLDKAMLDYDVNDEEFDKLKS